MRAFAAEPEIAFEPDDEQVSLVMGPSTGWEVDSGYGVT